LPNFSEVATANRENLRDLTEANPTLLRDWGFAPPHIPQFLAVARSPSPTSNIPADNPGTDYKAKDAVSQDTGNTGWRGDRVHNGRVIDVTAQWPELRVLKRLEAHPENQGCMG
jgi:hypothetical protein